MTILDHVFGRRHDLPGPQSMNPKQVFRPAQPATPSRQFPSPEPSQLLRALGQNSLSRRLRDYGPVVSQVSDPGSQIRGVLADPSKAQIGGKLTSVRTNCHELALSALH